MRKFIWKFSFVCVGDIALHLWIVAYAYHLNKVALLGRKPSFCYLKVSSVVIVFGYIKTTKMFVGVSFLSHFDH